MIPAEAPTWLSLIPAIVVIGVALATHNVIRALLGGIIAAVLLVAAGNIGQAISLGVKTFLQESSILRLLGGPGDLDHAYTFGFLICLGILIETITHTGGVAAYGAAVKRYFTTKKQAESAPLIIGPLFFLDDYLNNLVGGSVVRPLFTQFGIAYAKLAYLLNALSSSQCLLIPASSWLVVIIMQLQNAGISTNPQANPLIWADAYSTYLQALPYVLYPIISIASAWFIVMGGISYGPMREAERAGNAPAAKRSVASDAAAPLSNFFVPLGSFIVSLPFMMAVCAGWSPWAEGMSFCSAITNTDYLLIALWKASALSVLISAIFFVGIRRMPLQSFGRLMYNGALSMVNSILLLTCAWTFSSLLKNHVHTGAYIAHGLLTHAPQWLLPAATFLTATGITALIGSSWGMISILIPLMIPIVAALAESGTPGAAIALANVPLLLPTIGAIMSGAAAGPHLSPITDAAIISSTTAGITSIQHIRTTIPYALPGILGALVGFIVFGCYATTLSTAITITIGTVVLTCLMLAVANALSKKKN